MFGKPSKIVDVHRDKFQEEHKLVGDVSLSTQEVDEQSKDEKSIASSLILTNRGV